MAIETLPLPAQDTELARLHGQAAKVHADASALLVTTDDERDFAVAYLAEIATVKKAAEARRVALVKPLNDHVSNVNAFVNTLIGPVDEADKLLRGRVLVYQQEQARKAEAERQRLEAIQRAAEDEARRQALEVTKKLEEAARLEALEAGGRDAAAAQAALDAALQAEEEATARRQEALALVVPPPLAKTVSTALGAATVRKVWTFRVVALSAVPREYLLVDEPKVRKAIAGGARDIPGLVIYQEEALSLRR